MRLHWHMTTSSWANRVTASSLARLTRRAAIADSLYPGRSVQDVPIRRLLGYLVAEAAASTPGRAG